MALLTSAATIVGCLFLVPQLWRLLRYRDASGVSPSAAAVGAVQTASWVCFGLGTGALAVVVPSVLALPQYVAMLILTTDPGHRARALVQESLAAAIVVACAGASTFAGHGPWPGLGGALTAAVTWQYLPAVAAAFGPDGVAGLSATTWLLIEGNGAIWVVYGLRTAAPAVSGYGCVLTLAAAAVLTAILVRRTAPADHRGSRARFGRRPAG